MTRVNCVSPIELTNQHLLAEYRELPRIRHAYPRNNTPVIPLEYILGKGHLTFFYNKGLWLENRHKELIAEMKLRGFTVNLPPLDLSHWPKWAMRNWIPTKEAIELNRARIAERLGAKEQ